MAGTPVEVPTRRETIKGGGALVGGGLLAGCAGESSPSTRANSSNTTDRDGSATTNEGDSYTVKLAPAGEVTFDSVPENVFTILGHHVDMVLALGRSDAINAMHAPSYHQSLYQKLVHRLDGVSVDWEGLYSSWPPTKEKLYALDSDVHIADPAKVASAEGWSSDDIKEIKQNIAPWFGNTFSSAHEKPPEKWTEKYEYYTLWEIFKRVAAVFREQERYEALAGIHSSMLESFKQSLPPKSERPSAAMVLFSSQNEDMWGYKINQRGYYAAHTRPLGATDALVQAFGSDFGKGENGKIDYEVLLEADPDVLLVLGPMASPHNMDKIKSSLKNHEVASEMTAVQEEQVYVQGARRQGPILNLFQLEMAAKQLYPKQFGKWPEYDGNGPYPEIPGEEQLFDRQQVTDIINGEF